MSKIRRASARTLRDSAGLIVCSCGCGRHPEPPRRTWFSQQCVDAWLEINDPSRMRRRVLARDHGICAACGADCIRVERRLDWHSVEVRWNPGAYSTRYREKITERFNRELFAVDQARWRRYQFRLGRAWEKRAQAAKAQGWPRYGQYGGGISCWQADHIVPVVEGGGQCGIENFRTLCCPCHKRETAQLAKRRAERRRAKSLA